MHLGLESCMRHREMFGERRPVGRLLSFALGRVPELRSPGAILLVNIVSA